MSRSSSSSYQSRSPTESEQSQGRSRSKQISSYFTAPSTQYVSPYSPVTTQQPPQIVSPQPRSSFDLYALSTEASAIGSRSASTAMSTYSSSSENSIYSSPGPQQYRVVTPGMMNNPGSLSAVSTSIYDSKFPRLLRCNSSLEGRGFLY